MNDTAVTGHQKQADIEFRQKLNMIYGKKRASKLQKLYDKLMATSPDDEDFDSLSDEISDCEMQFGYEKAFQREEKIRSLKNEISSYEKMRFCCKSMNEKCKYASINPTESFDVYSCIQRILRTHIAYDSSVGQSKFTLSDDLTLYCLGIDSEFEFCSGKKISTKTLLKRRDELVNNYFPILLLSAEVIVNDMFKSQSVENVKTVISTYIPLVVDIALTSDDLDECVDRIYLDAVNARKNNTEPQ